MKINIFTDPHLNVSRQAHTTPTSSQALNQRLFDAAMATKSAEMANYCAGDLFDKAFNPEWAVIQGIKVAENCYVLSGNHDETNREGTKCSLEVVKAAGVGKIYRTPSVSDVFWNKTADGVYMIPHHASQELFVRALREAAADSQGIGTAMVHCNRGEIMGDTPDSILVISKELEDELLKSFKRIFYGHEHGSHSNKVEGDVVTSKAVVLGNTHPTSFSDVSDKYRYEYCTETDVLKRIMIWSKDAKFLQLELGQPFPEGANPDVIEVTGKGSRIEVVEYMDALWSTYPATLMIRPNVTYTSATEVMEVTQADTVNLADAIAKDLDGEVKELFIKLLGNVSHGN